MTLAMQEEIVDAEIVPSKVEVLQQIERAIQFNTQGNAGHASFWDVAIWIADNHAWLALDFDSLGDLWEARFSHLEVVVPRSVRGRVVESFRRAGLTQQEIADKLKVGLRTVEREAATLNPPNGGFTITNSRGQARPASYKKREQPEPDEPLNVDKTTGEIKESEVEVTDYHHTPYAEGYVLFRDGGARTVSVGKDGRAHSHGTMQKAIDWARANPSEKNYDAAKASGISQSYITGAYASLRKNREIHAVNSTGRRPHEEFGVLATGVKHLGMSVEKFLTEGTIDFIEPDEIDYYMDGLKEGMAQLVKFQRAARALHKSGQQ